MKIVTRSGVFETNSSSVHSYTAPIKIKRMSFKDWARSKANKDKVVNIDFDWCPVIKRHLEEENKKYDSET